MKFLAAIQQIASGRPYPKHTEAGMSEGTVVIPRLTYLWRAGIGCSAGTAKGLATIGVSAYSPRIFALTGGLPQLKRTRIAMQSGNYRSANSPGTTPAMSYRNL